MRIDLVRLFERSLLNGAVRIGLWIVRRVLLGVFGATRLPQVVTSS
jgi:hypothetical protein